MNDNDKDKFKKRVQESRKHIEREVHYLEHAESLEEVKSIASTCRYYLQAMELDKRVLLIEKKKES